MTCSTRLPAEHGLRNLVLLDECIWKPLRRHWPIRQTSDLGDVNGTIKVRARSTATNPGLRNQIQTKALGRQTMDQTRRILALLHRVLVTYRKPLILPR